jgi:hypothetical protein
MTWVDLLQETAKAKQERKQRAKPKTAPLVHDVIVMVRRPSENDPGEVTTGYFTLEDNQLWLTDQNGIPLKEFMAVKLESEANARSIAASLTKERWSKARGGFWRQL